MKTPAPKRVKVLLTNKRFEIVEMPAAVSKETWWNGILHNGSKLAYLNGTGYPKSEVVGPEDVQRRTGSTDMRGV